MSISIDKIVLCSPGELVLFSAHSQKSGNDYVALGLDLGYRRVVLSVDGSTISEILNLTPRDYGELRKGLLENVPSQMPVTLVSPDEV